MTSKVIVAKSMQQGMREAKRIYGDNAVIVYSREIGSQIELMIADGSAAVANDDQHDQQLTEPTADAMDSSQSPASFKQVLAASSEHSQSNQSPVRSEQEAVDTELDSDEISPDDPGFRQFMGELRGLAEFWNEFGSYWEDYSDACEYPGAKTLAERLGKLQLAAELKTRFIAEFKAMPEIEHAWQLVLAALQDGIKPSAANPINDGGRYVFVGPSGAGKTTTIGKIAAEYVLRHGSDSVGLITTDIFRIGACEQLQAIGKILDVEVEVIDVEQQGLSVALNKFSDRSLVLIDTAGLRRNDRDLSRQLLELRQQGERLQSMLVLPATSQYESMIAAMEAYDSVSYSGCVFTRLDECTSLGAAVSMLVKTSLPIGYLANGQAIPDDLARANSLMIIEQMLALAFTDRATEGYLRNVDSKQNVSDHNRQMKLI